MSLLPRYTKIRVEHVSLETYEEEGEIFGDDGFQMAEGYGQFEKDFFLQCLTGRQRKVAELLFSGYKRQEIASHPEINVCIQAIHQIIPRIRKRLAKKAGVSTKGWKRANAYK